MKSKIDLIYDDLAGRIKYGKLVFTSDPIENLRILDRELATVNIAKCSLSDLEKEMEGSTAYLLYLLQSKKDVDFNFPKNTIVWVNTSGVRMKKVNEIFENK